jgi:hypothetical protein
VTGPGLSITDFLDDPYFREQLGRSSVGRGELNRIDAQKNKQELENAISQAKARHSSLPATEQARNAEWIRGAEGRLKDLDTIIESGRAPAPDRSATGNFARGSAAGFFGSLPDFVGLLTGTAKHLPDSVRPSLVDAADDKAKELSSEMREFFNPQGTSGDVGEFVGGVAGGIPTYGTTATLGARVLASGAEKAGAAGIANLLRTSLAGSAGRRAAASVVGGLPLSALMQTGMPEGATVEDRAKQFAIQTLADAAGGALHGVPGKLGRRLSDRLGGVEPSGNGGPGGPAPSGGSPSTPTGQSILDELTGSAEKNKTEKAAKSAMRARYNGDSSVQAAIEYEQTNPGKRWIQLAADEQKKLREDWKTRNPFDKWASDREALNAGAPGVDPNAPPASPPSAEAQAAMVPPLRPEDFGAPPVEASPAPPGQLDPAFSQPPAGGRILEPLKVIKQTLEDHGMQVGPEQEKYLVDKLQFIDSQNLDTAARNRKVIDLIGEVMATGFPEKPAAVEPEAPSYTNSDTSKENAAYAEAFKQFQGHPAFAQPAGPNENMAVHNLAQVFGEVAAANPHKAAELTQVFKEFRSAIESAPYPATNGGDVAPVQVPSAQGKFNYEAMRAEAENSNKAFPMDQPGISPLERLQRIYTYMVMTNPDQLRPLTHAFREAREALGKVAEQPKAPTHPDLENSNFTAYRGATEGSENTKDMAFMSVDPVRAGNYGTDVYKVSGKFKKVMQVSSLSEIYDRLGIKKPADPHDLDKAGRAALRAAGYDAIALRDPLQPHLELISLNPSAHNFEKLPAEEVKSHVDLLGTSQRPEGMVAEFPQQTPPELPTSETVAASTEGDIVSQLLGQQPTARESNPRLWWNQLSSKDRKAWINAVDPETAKLRAIADMRYDALSTKRRPAVDQAHQAYLAGNAPDTYVPQGTSPSVNPSTSSARPRLADSQLEIASAVHEQNQSKGQLNILPIVRQATRNVTALSDQELASHISSAATGSAGAKSESVRAEWDRITQKLVAEQQRRQVDQGNREGFANFRLLSTVAGGFTGFTVGAATTDPGDPNRNAKLFMWTLVGLGAGMYGGKVLDAGLAKRLERDNYQLKTEPLSNVVSLETLEANKSKGLYERLADFYQSGFRGISSAERVLWNLRSYTEDLTRKAQHNLNLFGWHVAGTESWLTDRPVVRGDNGEPIHLNKADGTPIWPMSKILQAARGDQKGLGDLATALSTLEQFGMGRDPGTMSQAKATMIVQQAPQHMIQAALELREYNLGLAKALLMTGRLTQQGFDAMAKEKYYTPMYRVLEGGKVSDIRRGVQAVRPNDPLKSRSEGSERKVINPVEQTIALTPRYLRAIEMNQVVKSFIDVGRQIGDKEIQSMYMRLVKPDGAQGKAVRELEADMRDLAQKMGVHPKDIGGLITYAEGDKPLFQGGRIVYWDNGVLHTYEVAEPIFKGLASLLPDERDLFKNIFVRGAHSTTMGIVNNPVFLVRQLVMDSIDAATMSKYGFRMGWDSARALYHIYSRSPEYKKLLEMGGPGTVQSLKFLDPQRVLASVEAEGGTAFATAWKQMKELHPVEAYKTLALPLAEAARVGEALRAMDHGASTVESVYAAWNVLGNTRMQGTSAFIRALNQMVPFFRAGTAVIDQQAANLGVHAFRTPEGGRVKSGLGLLAKGVINMTIPTMLLWAYNKDDQELREWRKTTAGQNYWFLRSPKDGTIIRIPKPHDLGVIFASAVENALDKQYAQDSATLSQWSNDLLDQVAVNFWPTLLGVPASLLANRQLGFGNRPIVPDSQTDMDPQFQGHDTATAPAQMVGSVLGVSPLKVDYAVNSTLGSTGQQLMQFGDAVKKYVDTGYVPAAHEYPVIRSFLVHYPATNTGSVEQFYNNVEKAEAVYSAWNHLINDDPQAAVTYGQQHPVEMQMAQALIGIRNDIADARRAANDLGHLGRAYMSSEKQRELQGQFARQIIMQAKMGNMLWKQAQQMRKVR